MAKCRSDLFIESKTEKKGDMKMLILVANNEVKLRKNVVELLKAEGYQTLEATNGFSAWEVVSKYPIDLAILDVEMTKLTGLEVCQKIKETRKIPVILISFASSEEDRLNGFAAGAEDYIVKPYYVRELVARVNVILKRNTQAVLQFKGIELDTKAHIVKVDGVEISANRKEFSLMKLFFENVNKTLSRDDLIKNIWGWETQNVDRTIDTHIKMLRTKMGPYGSDLKTIRGVGYKLEE